MLLVILTISPKNVDGHTDLCIWQRPCHDDHIATRGGVESVVHDSFRIIPGHELLLNFAGSMLRFKKSTHDLREACCL